MSAGGDVKILEKPLGEVFSLDDIQKVSDHILLFFGFCRICVGCKGQRGVSCFVTNWSINSGKGFWFLVSTSIFFLLGIKLLVNRNQYLIYLLNLPSPLIYADLSAIKYDKYLDKIRNCLFSALCPVMSNSTVHFDSPSHRNYVLFLIGWIINLFFQLSTS